MRLTITRAVSGLSVLAIQRAKAARRPVDRAALPTPGESDARRTEPFASAPADSATRGDVVAASTSGKPGSNCSPSRASGIVVGGATGPTSATPIVTGGAAGL